jgi:hypothetical protein
MTINDTSYSQFSVTALSKRDAIDRVSRIKTERDAQNVYSAAKAGGDTVLVEVLEGAAVSRHWDLSTSTAPGAEATTTRTLLIDLINLAIGAAPQISVGENYNDPCLTVDALQEARQTLVSATTDELGMQATKIVAQISTLADKATTQADQVWPVLDPNDATQVARVGMAWQFSLMPALAGLSNPIWAPILDGLDIDGLLALQKFGPMWIKNATTSSSDASVKTAELLNSINSRIPGAVTDPTTRALLTNAASTVENLGNAKQIASVLTTVKTSMQATMANTQTKMIAGHIGAGNAIVTPTPFFRQVY